MSLRWNCNSFSCSSVHSIPRILFWHFCIFCRVWMFEFRLVQMWVPTACKRCSTPSERKSWGKWTKYIFSTYRESVRWKGSLLSNKMAADGDVSCSTNIYRCKELNMWNSLNISITNMCRRHEENIPSAKCRAPKTFTIFISRPRTRPWFCRHYGWSLKLLTLPIRNIVNM